MRNFIVCIVRVIKSRRLRWAGHVARIDEGRSAFKIFTGTPTEKRPLGRPRRKWENNIRMYIKEIGINTRNWVNSSQDRGHWRVIVNAALNLRVPKAMELFPSVTSTLEKTGQGLGLDSILEEAACNLKSEGSELAAATGRVHCS